MKCFYSPLAILALAACLMAACSTDTPQATGKAVETATEEREPAPDFALQNAESKDVQLSDYRGKVVLLNFWATWCGPCKIEMPWFVEFQRKYKDRGFSVIAVSLDEQGWEVVKPFVEELKLNFPVVIGDDEVANDYGGVAALPTTFMIDKEGKIASTHQGLVSKSDYEDEIERLL